MEHFSVRLYRVTGPSLTDSEVRVAGGLSDIRYTKLRGRLKSFILQRCISRLTDRLAADGAQIIYRGEWVAVERAIVEAAGHREGDAIDCEFFPRLWVAGQH